MERIDILLLLAEKGGLYESISVTTGDLSKTLSVSQQTASNALRRLEDEELIERTPHHLGVRVRITEKGRGDLKRYRDRLSILSGKKDIKGKVVTGVGEGKFYMHQNGYRKQFMDKLNIIAYPGTLNLKVDPAERSKYLEEKKAVNIDGFVTKNRSFGSLKCFKVVINGVDGAVVMPERSHYHDDILEIISNDYLRKRLDLKDGSEVVINGK